ncbi:MAG: DUF6259 domain-containing protein [Candidatus Latescibacterota bacterium]
MSIISLENGLVRFVFDKQTGSLMEMDDLATGRRNVADSAHGRFFRVVCPSEIWMSRHADSHEADPPEIASEPGRLTIRYPALRAMDGPMPISATVTVELPPGKSEARFGIEIANGCADRVHEVRFPWLAVWTRTDDKALWGTCPAKPYPSDPETFAYNLMGSHRRSFNNYAGMMLPFFDLSGEDGGISYICYQERPSLGGVSIENLDPEPNGFLGSFSWVHFPFIPPGETWRSPVIGIGVHSGDWHATADRFREWMDGWWKAPQAPKRLRESIGFQTIQIRTFDGVPIHRFEDIPKLAADGMKYGVSDLCIWDPIAGVYLRPDDGDFWEEFDPSQSIDDLRAGLAEARRTGCNVSTLVNYRLIRGNSSLYRKIGDDQVQRTSYGSPVIEDWSTCTARHVSFNTGYLGREGRVLCQRSPGFRERAMAITKATMELGFTSLFIDQAFDCNPCFAEHHGHVSPSDTYEAAVEWSAEAARMVRSRDLEAYVIGENCDVFQSQEINVSWYWGWSAAASQVMRYTIPEAMLCWVIDHQPVELNRAFAQGFLVAFTTSMAEQSLEVYPEFGARVAQLAKLRKQTADFIAHGRFRDNVGLQVKDVIAYVYTSPQGLGVTVAETENRARRACVVLDPTVLGRGNPQRGTLCRQDGSTSPAGRVLPDGRIELELELPALEVAVWTVPCAG